MEPDGSVGGHSGDQGVGIWRAAAERGVSPVVGAALLIGIVVILAAVLGTFVLSLGPSNEGPPEASFAYTEQRVDVFTDNGGNRWAGVLALEITHRNGDQVARRFLDVRHKPDTGGQVRGYALGIRADENVTDPRWNRESEKDDRGIEGGDTTRYFLYMSEAIGTHGEFDEQTVDYAWSRDRCTIERFGEPRRISTAPKGVLNFSSSGAATRRCPAPSDGYNVTSIKTGQAGRIRPGDTTQLVWDTGGETTSPIGEYVVRELN